jgi:hypothetical protein
VAIAVLKEMSVVNVQISVDGEHFMARTKQSTAHTSVSQPITLLSIAVIGFLVGVSQTASAQDASIAQPQQIFQDQQTRDPFSNRGSDQSGGVMDLIHRAMQAGGTSNEDFVSGQQENLDSATEAFRAAQQKRLTGTPTAPAATPGTLTTPKN